MTACWPLPAEPHIPGQTPRPEVSPAFEAAASAPPRTVPEDWAAHAAYLYGFDLYAGAFFWEAHEVWEPVWMGAPPNGRARALLQGLIQLANACLKLRMDRPRAADRLLRLAGACFRDAGERPLMGLDPAELADATARFRDAARDGGISARPELRPEQQYSS